MQKSCNPIAAKRLMQHPTPVVCSGHKERGERGRRVRWSTPPGRPSVRSRATGSDGGTPQQVCHQARNANNVANKVSWVPRIDRLDSIFPSVAIPSSSYQTAFKQRRVPFVRLNSNIVFTAQSQHHITVAHLGADAWIPSAPRHFHHRPLGSEPSS